jgi:hypothetical protein
MYDGVPRVMPVAVTIPDTTAALAMPKSMIRTTPSWSSRMLDGLRSRCTTGAGLPSIVTPQWALSRPAQSWMPRSRAWDAGNGPDLRIRSSPTPSTSSIEMKGYRPISPKS